MSLLKRILWLLLFFAILWWFGARSDASYSLSPEDRSNLSVTEAFQLEIVNKINAVVWSETIAEAIVVGCMNHTENYIKCMRHTFGVANAESSLFKNVSSKNNAFWIMEKVCGKKPWWEYSCSYKVKSYSSVEESVIDFIKKYEKNKWYNRDSGQAWLNGKYCTSQCSNRIPAYNDWMAEFDLSLI